MRVASLSCLPKKRQFDTWEMSDQPPMTIGGPEVLRVPNRFWISRQKVFWVHVMLDSYAFIV